MILLNNMSTFTDEQKEEIKGIFREALNEYFATQGKTAKAVLLGMATIIGSLVVIFGGFKWFLGVIGFTYMR